MSCVVSSSLARQALREARQRRGDAVPCSPAVSEGTSPTRQPTFSHLFDQCDGRSATRLTSVTAGLLRVARLTSSLGPIVTRLTSVTAGLLRVARLTSAMVGQTVTRLARTR